MKKVGILIFAAAAIVGIAISSFFSYGKVDYRFINFSFNEKVRGSGNIVSESRDVGDFRGVNVSSVFQVEIVAQEDFAVEVEADDNLLPLIRTEVRNGVLHIEAAERIKSRNALKVRISAPDIEEVRASGASRVDVSGVRNEQFRIGTSGASKISLSGESTKLEIEVSGASSIDAANLKAEDATVNASGASHVSVFATTELVADASGASRIVYSGSPKNIRKHSSGASSVREK